MARLLLSAPHRVRWLCSGQPALHRLLGHTGGIIPADMASFSHLSQRGHLPRHPSQNRATQDSITHRAASPPLRLCVLHPCREGNCASASQSWRKRRAGWTLRLWRLQLQQRERKTMGLVATSRTRLPRLQRHAQLSSSASLSGARPLTPCCLPRVSCWVDQAICREFPAGLIRRSALALQPNEASCWGAGTPSNAQAASLMPRLPYSRGAPVM